MASREALDAAAAYADLLTCPVDAVAADLDSYAALLRKWQGVQNLVSRETLPDLWSRHIRDSLQVLRYIDPEDETFLDLGSGGGLPAIPLAIACKRSNRRFVLVEPIARKASFLRTVSRELGLPVTVLNGRIEQFDSREAGEVDVITARALAGLSVLCAYMETHFRPKTKALLHKGRDFREEIAQADSAWDFSVLHYSSDTDAQGVILELRHLRRKTVR